VRHREESSRDRGGGNGTEMTETRQTKSCVERQEDDRGKRPEIRESETTGREVTEDEGIIRVQKEDERDEEQKVGGGYGTESDGGYHCSCWGC